MNETKEYTKDGKQVTMDGHFLNCRELTARLEAETRERVGIDERVDALGIRIDEISNTLNQLLDILGGVADDS